MIRPVAPPQTRSTEDRAPAFAPQVPLLVAFGLTSLLNYGFSLLASRILAPGDFGLVAFAQATLLLAGLVLQSGVPWSLARALVTADEAERGRLVRGALVANLGLALAIDVVLVLLFFGGVMEEGLEGAGTLVLCVVSLPLFAVAAVGRSAMQGMGRFGSVGAIQAIEVAVKAVAGLGLALVGLGAPGAVAGFPVGGLAAAGLAMVLLSIFGRVRPTGGVRMPSTRSVGPMFGALIGLALVLNLDLIAVKLLDVDRAAAGQYQAAIILANAPFFLVSSAIVPILFTRLASHVSVAETRSRVAGALRVAIALVLPFEFVLVAIPDQVLAVLFPPAYAGAAPILRLMAVGNAALIVAAIFAAAFQAVDRAGEVARIVLAVAVIEAAVLVAVVPRFGPQGAVLSFDAATLVCTVLLALRYRTEARVELGPTARWLLRFALAGAAGTIVAIGVALVPGSGPLYGAFGGILAYYLAAVRLGLMAVSPRAVLEGQT